MANSQTHTEVSLQNALKNVKKLRSTVTELFQRLQRSGDENTEEKEFQMDIYHRLMAVSHCFAELEKGAGVSSTQNLMQSNISMLNLDPFLDRSQTYNELDNAYKWLNRTHELSTYAATKLNSQSLKRTGTYIPHIIQRKRVSRPLALSMGEDDIEKELEKIQRSHPHLHLEIYNAKGTSPMIVLRVETAFRAVIGLRGLLLESVVIKGLDEEYKNNNGLPELCKSSRHHVFRAVTVQAQAALLAVMSMSRPDQVLTGVLKWLDGYKTLFSAPCHMCGRILSDLLPPIKRDFQNTLPCHISCPK